MVQEIGTFCSHVSDHGGKSDNMKLAAKNQFMEGMINNEKKSLQKSRVISVNLICISGTFTRTWPWKASILWLNWRIPKDGYRPGNARQRKKCIEEMGGGGRGGVEWRC